MRIKGQVKGLRGIDDVLPLAIQVLVDEAVIAAGATAKEQRALILADATPLGAPQKMNAKGTIARKARRKVSPNVPLYDTGVLANPANWRVRKLPGGRGAKLLPPRDRAVALNVLRKRGYVTVFDALPTTITEATRDRVERRMKVLSRRRF